MLTAKASVPLQGEVTKSTTALTWLDSYGSIPLHLGKTAVHRDMFEGFWGYILNTGKKLICWDVACFLHNMPPQLQLQHLSKKYSTKQKHQTKTKPIIKGFLGPNLKEHKSTINISTDRKTRHIQHRECSGSWRKVREPFGKQEQLKQKRASR